ncbi:MAG: 3-phosphoshikimate 1-carboxyvinyltransferase [Flavitalea sp.]
MITTITPSSVTGTIQAAASKSSMQRACAAALLSKGTTTIVHPGKSNDDLAAIDVIQKLGAKVDFKSNGDIEIESNGVQPVGNEINCGESGLGIRMFSPLAALSEKPLTINGSGSLVKRPMDFFDEIFPQLGIKIQSQEGKLPLLIQGPLQPANIEIDGSLSSQFLTGLLMGYAAANASDVTITVRDLKSRPYIDLTLDVMEKFGVKIVNNDYASFYFPANNAAFKGGRYTVEGDWSGGAFLLVAGAIAGEITVKGLDPFSTQADKAILQAISDSGAVLSISPEQIVVGPNKLKAFQFDATDCPDLFPPLVALAAYCEGTSVITGVNRLTHKESNRSLTLQEEFGKMGIEIVLQDDLMLIKGGTGVKGAMVHSHHDHRIAMACAVAGLKATGETTIEVAEAIGKSYPNFYEHLQILGVSVNSVSEPVNH